MRDEVLAPQDLAERAREKQASRDADYARIAADASAVEAVRAENAFIPAEYCRGRIDWSRSRPRI